MPKYRVYAVDGRGLLHTITAPKLADDEVAIEFALAGVRPGQGAQVWRGAATCVAKIDRNGRIDRLLPHNKKLGARAISQFRRG